MSTETGESENTEFNPPRFIAYEGFSFLPTSAGISLFATTSLLVTLVSEPGALPDWAQAALGFTLFVMTAAALVTSLIGVTVLLARGLAASGALVIGGWHCSGAALGGVFMLCYLAPWIAALATYPFTGLLL